VVDRLRQLNVPVTGVNFGGKPARVSLGQPSETMVHYANRRAEIYGYMREWLERGAIPDSEDIQVDLTGVKYGFNADNAIQLERKEDMKKRGLASPDNADALALTFAEPVLRAQDGRRGIEGLGGGSRIVSEYDPFGGLAA
jgi:hypothetical protein